MFRFIFILGLIYPSFGFSVIHPSCSDYHTTNSMIGLKVTKTLYAKNEIHLHINTTKNCSIDWSKNEPLKLFWYLGKRYGQPCEDLLNKEVRDLLGFSDHYDMSSNFLTKLSETEAKLYIPNLPLLSQKVGDNTEVSPYINVRLKNLNTQCTSEVSISLNKKTYKFNRLHATIRFFSLREVFFYDNSKKVYVLK